MHPQVEAVTPLVTLALARETFLSVLGPLEALLTREKSPQARRVGVEDILCWGFRLRRVDS